MSLVVATEGEEEFLRAAAVGSLPGVEMHLYKNDFTPDEEVELADLTEADFPGYASVTLDGTWTAPAVIGPRWETKHTPNAEFERNATGAVQDIYGYFVTMNSGTALLWVERFVNGPFPVEEEFDKIIVTPKLTSRSEFGQVG